jgi:ubiquitin carboxyl-terminal hydrolase 8
VDLFHVFRIFIFRSFNETIKILSFKGLFKSTVQCLTCQQKSVKFEPFMYLTIPIELKKLRCTVFDCIELFLQPETMCGESKWLCPNCKQKRDARKKIDIWSLPRLLIIHLKRFRHDGAWGDKISSFVDYPLNNLNLSPYVLNSKSSDSIYNLYGTCNHTGTLNGGHYIATCKNSQNKEWYKYDDCSVKQVDRDTIKSTSAYILFYAAV